jgi:cell division GTPase FtsZ
MVMQVLVSGGNLLLGEQVADESKEAIANVLKGSDLVFITAGMGGGTGYMIYCIGEDSIYNNL